MIFNMIASGGGASAPRFGVAFGTPEPSPGTSLSFTNLLGEPQVFCVILVPKGTSNKVSPYLDNTNQHMVTHFVYDGVEISTGVFSKSSTYPFDAYGNGYNAKQNQYSFTYSNGTLTLNTTHVGNSSGAFYASSGQYELLYIY